MSELLAPKGMGLFVRKLSKARHGSPNAFAYKCRKHGLRWVALAGPYQDMNDLGNPRIQRLNMIGTIADYGRALFEQGITPHIWGQVMPGRTESFLGEMNEITSPEIGGWLILADSLQDHPHVMAQLFRMAMQDMPGKKIGFGSRGLSEGQQAPICHYGSIELCGWREDWRKEALIKLIQFHRAGVDNVVPTFPVCNAIKRHGKTVEVPMTREQLHNHLRILGLSKVKIHGAIGWSENFMNSKLWEVVAQWGHRINTGETAL
jgi:hypothetical protein